MPCPTTVNGGKVATHLGGEVGGRESGPGGGCCRRLNARTGRCREPRARDLPGQAGSWVGTDAARRRCRSAAGRIGVRQTTRRGGSRADDSRAGPGDADVVGGRGRCPVAAAVVTAPAGQKHAKHERAQEEPCRPSKLRCHVVSLPVVVARVALAHLLDHSFYRGFFLRETVKKSKELAQNVLDALVRSGSGSGSSASPSPEATAE